MRFWRKKVINKQFPNIHTTFNNYDILLIEVMEMKVITELIVAFFLMFGVVVGGTPVEKPAPYCAHSSCWTEL